MNRLQISGLIQLAEPLAYTPSGVAVMVLVIQHDSQQPTDYGFQNVALSLTAVAFADLAVDLSRIIQSRCLYTGEFEGFLTPLRRNSSLIKLQLTHYQNIKQSHY